MRVEVVRADELSEYHLDRWRAIQISNPELRSPYFAPEFARAVSEERDDVFVGVIEGQAGIEAFFPFHRGPDGTGMPIGLRICDYHGVIAQDPSPWSAVELLRGCGLKQWDFRCVPVSQTIFHPWQTTIMPTASIDMSAGLDHGRLTRIRPRVEKDTGPLRFTWHVSDPAALQSLLECKSAQYQRTGIGDVFEPPWIPRVLMRLNEATDPGCRGVLSELHAGDKLLAAHFGIRSATVLHYWFPCYAQEFARYSPGLMLLLEIVRHASGEGISRIDLGMANADYKARFANTTGAVARGSVTVAAGEFNL